MFRMLSSSDGVSDTETYARGLTEIFFQSVTFSLTPVYTWTTFMHSGLTIATDQTLLHAMSLSLRWQQLAFLQVGEFPVFSNRMSRIAF